jgi:hypothetical protein
MALRPQPWALHSVPNGVAPCCQGIYPLYKMEGHVHRGLGVWRAEFTLMWLCNMCIHTVRYGLSCREPPVPFPFFNTESNNHWFWFFRKTLNKNQRVSWKNRQFFNCFVYFWESHSSYIEFNSSNIFRTNQWASEYVPELITDRYLSLSLRTPQHWCLRSLSLFRTSGGPWACFSSPVGTFFLRGHFASCNKNLICSRECIETFKASTNFFDQACFRAHFS